MTARRVVSLVPSLTELVAALGVADRVVGVTRYCVRGAPPHAAVVGGTKNPEVDAVVALRPDLVLANSEENRPEDLDALRGMGAHVLETYPRTVRDVRTLLTDVADAVGADATPLRVRLDDALAEAAARRPATPVAALTLIWRKPWRGVGPDTFIDDLLRVCGFANVLAGFDQRYPRLEEGLLLGPQVVLLPTEPYAFGEDDLPAVRALAGDVAARFVDGELLTWHGARTADALDAFSALAKDLAQNA
jgi:ABC-type Fe3+-hydroxamate transport system substrate-binding protein